MEYGLKIVYFLLVSQYYDTKQFYQIWMTSACTRCMALNSGTRRGI